MLVLGTYQIYEFLFLLNSLLEKYEYFVYLLLVLGIELMATPPSSRSVGILISRLFS
jgi:hypothetical protein